MTFERDPLSWIEGANRPVAHEAIRKYRDSFSGIGFEELIATTDPNVFTAQDLVAVTMLSVQVPAPAARWLLSSGGRQESAELLGQIPADPIWRVDAAVLGDGSPASLLWALLQANSTQIGRHGSNDIGPVTAGKLLAAKRPHLIPVYDRHVGQALCSAPGQFWLSWQEALKRPEARAVINEFRLEVARYHPAVAMISDLRLLDIVIWMSEQGWKSIGQRPKVAAEDA